VELDEALSDFLKFIEDFPLIAHNIAFDLGFIQQNCRECDLSVPKNKTFDTLEMVRRLYPKASSHKLTAMVEYLGFTPHKAHRSIADCENIWMIYQKMTQSINS
jgi:DNA polymerase-3 subunit alpha (Gram-positive type)